MRYLNQESHVQIQGKYEIIKKKKKNINKKTNKKNTDIPENRTRA